MRKIAISVLLTLLSTFFVMCRADKTEYVAIEKALESISKVVVKYKSEFDTKVKFVELQGAIDAIGESMLDYQGTAKGKLDQIRRLNAAARNTYHDCVGPVFEWCVAVNSTIDIFIPYIIDEGLTEHDKNIIWNMTVESMADGQKRTLESLELLKVVQNRTSELKILLDAMLSDVHNDFGPQGFYGKQKEELKNSIAKNGDRTHNLALIIAATISIIFLGIATIVAGPIGIALGLLSMFSRVGLDEVIQGKRKACLEEEIRAIEMFFTLIDEKIHKASLTAAQVEEELKEEKINLHALGGYIAAAKNNNKLLLMESKTLRAKLIPPFRELGKNCYEYTIKHGYGSAGYKHRARREATKICYAWRIKAAEMILGTIPFNITFKNTISKAHSILNEMDCGTATLLTPIGNEQTPLQSLNENSGPVSIEELSKESLRSRNLQPKTLSF